MSETPRAATYEQEVARRRQIIMERLAHLHDPDGVNTDRAHRFVQALGLTVNPHGIIINARHTFEVEQVVSAVRGSPYARGGAEGHYFPGVGMYVAYRKPGNASEVEENYIHEATHAATALVPPGRRGLRWWLAAPLRSKSRTHPNSGFFNGAPGAFYREGWATWVQTGYSHTTNPTAKWQTWRPDHNYQHLGPYRGAAGAFDLLFAADPALTEVTVAAQTDPQAVREFKERVTAIKPGLFGRLLSIEMPTSPDPAAYREQVFNRFDAGYELVCKAMGVGQHEAAAIQRTGPGFQLIQRRVEEYSQTTGYTGWVDTPQP